jgi:hypothetical protein
MNKIMTELQKYEQDFSPVFDIFEKLEIDFSDCKTIEEVHARIERDFQLNKDGVYCNWNNAYFRDYDEAVEIMKEDEAAVYAAFGGYVKFQDCPYCENLYNGYVKSLSVEQAIMIDNFLNRFIDL